MNAFDELDDLFHAVPVGLAVLDEKLRFVRINRWLAEHSQFPAASLVGRTLEAVFPEIAAQVIPAIRQAVQTQEPVLDLKVAVQTGKRNDDAPQPDANPTPGCWLASCHPVENAEGTGKHISVVFQDISKYQRDIATLKEKQLGLELAIQSSSDGFWDWPDISEDAQWWSTRGYELLGFADGDVEACGSQLIAALHPDDIDRVRNAISKHLEEGAPCDLEYRIRTKSEGYRWLHGRGQAIWDDQGNPVRMSGSMRDISNQRSVEQQLRTTVDYLDAILLNLPVGVAIMEGPEFRYYRINSNLAEINGLPVADHLGRPLAEVLPDAVADLVPTMRRVLETGESSLSREFSTRLPGNPGEVRHFIDSMFAIKVSEGTPSAVGAVVLDITDRKNAEEMLKTAYEDLEQRVRERTLELRESNLLLTQEIDERKNTELALRASEKRLAQYIDIAADAILTVDATRHIHLFNKAAETTFGYSAHEVIGQTIDRLIPPRLYGRHLERFSSLIDASRAPGPMPLRGRVRAQRKNGEEFPAEIAVAKTETEGHLVFFVVLRDLSEQEQVENAISRQREEFSHLLRASTIGELTATLAHELNQPLTAIRTNAQAAKRFMAADVPDLGELREILDDIIADNRRASEVIRHARSLLKKRKTDIEPLDINEVVEEVLGLVNSEALIRNVVVMSELNDGLPRIMGDRIQVQQVLLNLILNGFDAIHNGITERRQVSITTELQDEASVCVSVADTGAGFSEQDPELLFEPFYTTKESGLGMGLTINRTIIEAHGGKIWALENSDLGTIFRFTLRVAGKEVPAKPV